MLPPGLTDTVSLIRTEGRFRRENPVSAGLDAVQGLIYVAAFELDVGETLLSSVGGVIPDWWDIHEEEGYLDALHPEDVFWGDLTPQATRKAAIGPQQKAAESGGPPMPKEMPICRARPCRI
jgi:hypothetical protein